MKRRKSHTGHLFIHILFMVFCLLCIIPIVAIISVSLSSMSDIMKYGYRLIPAKLDYSAFTYIFSTPGVILNAYMISIIVTLLGTILGLIVNSMIAYPLSRTEFKLKNILMIFVFFPMLFDGGLVPWYVLISRYLGLKNTIFALILPKLASCWYILLLRTFFSKLPKDTLEYARIDGASELRVFFRIVLPLSTPALAAVGFLTMLTFWNDWFSAMLFIEKDSLLPLQYMLQRIMNNILYLTTQITGTMSSTIDTSNLPTENARMAMCVLAAGPMLFVFQFFQKYFVKGLTVGSLKG